MNRFGGFPNKGTMFFSTYLIPCISRTSKRNHQSTTVRIYDVEKASAICASQQSVSIRQIIG